MVIKIPYKINGYGLPPEVGRLIMLAVTLTSIVRMHDQTSTRAPGVCMTIISSPSASSRYPVTD